VTADLLPDPLDIAQTEPPGYVATPAERERWALCNSIALEMWRLYGEGEPLDRRWYWQTVRSIYRSDVGTGSSVNS
jgi:hypothetical protein